MSLMNYGFTKSKLDENVDEKRSDGKSKEKSPKSSKSPSKLNKEGGSKEGKDKKVKVSGSKSSIKKELNKPHSKSPVKKSSPKKSSEFKQKQHNTLPNMNSSSKMNGTHKPNSKGDGPSNISSSGSSCSNSPKRSHDVSLPYVRIKMIMKSCPDVEIVPHEALHVITKATELFIQHLATESLKSSDSVMLDYEALSNKVHKEDNLEFLKETIPKKITWEECQKIIASKKTNTSNELL